MKQKPTPLSFPKRFFWGAATAAHQVEGGMHNDWTVWELEHANVLAQQAKYRYNYLPKWSEIETEAADPNNYISGKGVDHYNRYEEDFKILKELNMNAFSFSIEWSRIEPEEGRWSAAAIEHYRDYLRALKERNIEPFVALWHWTLPVWFAEKGGFEKRRNIKYFVRFAQKVFEELGREFRYVITIKEPDTYMAQSYVVGARPPMKQQKLLAVWVYLNLALAHKKVYKLAKKTSRKFIVGMAKLNDYHYAGDDAIISKWSAAVAIWGADYFFLNRIKGQLDFLGMDYYFSNRFYGYRIHNPDERLSDIGSDMQPQNIQFVLERLYQKYKLPIIITENGCADRNDEYRKWWLMQTLLAMHKAMQNGVRLEGYLHWSLLDNLEWDYGFWPQFGLVAVDRKTMKRTVRPSAQWFAKTIDKLRS